MMRGLTAVGATLALGLVLVGCGGSGSSGISSQGSAPAEPTPSVSTHLTEKGEPELIAVPGYEYQDNAYAASFAQQAEEQLKGVFNAFSLHNVMRGEELVGELMLMGATPEAVAAYDSGAVDPIGGHDDPGESYVTIAGDRVVCMEDAPGSGSTAWVWYHDGTMTKFFQKATRSQAMDFLVASLNEANRS